MGQRLPLWPRNDAPSFVFGTTLGEGEEQRQYRFAFHWNARAGEDGGAGWFMDVLESDDTPIRMGIRVVLGARLGRRVADSRFPPGELIARDLSGAGKEATLDDLGIRVVIDYTSPEELAAFAALREATT